MGYAFISYSTKNQSSADAMRELFNKNNIETWMAPYDIPAGSKYAAVITKAIRECSCFVLLLSNDSQSSEAVDSEVELAALAFKKSIITVELEKVVLNDSFFLYIHNKQIIAINQINEDSNEIKQVLTAVKAYTMPHEQSQIALDQNSDIRKKDKNDESNDDSEDIIKNKNQINDELTAFDIEDDLLSESIVEDRFIINESEQKNDTAEDSKEIEIDDSLEDEPVPELVGDAKTEDEMVYSENSTYENKDPVEVIDNNNPDVNNNESVIDNGEIDNSHQTDKNTAESLNDFVIENGVLVKYQGNGRDVHIPRKYS